MINEIIFYIALGWFLTTFEPIQQTLCKGFKEIATKISIAPALYSAISCWVCVSFWVSLVATGWDFKTALFVSFGSFIIEQCLTRLR